MIVSPPPAGGACGHTTFFLRLLLRVLREFVPSFLQIKNVGCSRASVKIFHAADAAADAIAATVATAAANDDDSDDDAATDYCRGLTFPPMQTADS